jgi:hypothetical protein
MEKEKQGPSLPVEHRLRIKGVENLKGTKTYKLKNKKQATPILTIQDDFNIMFHNKKGDVIGKVFIENDVMKFEGEADESAKVFFDSVIKQHLTN